MDPYYHEEARDGQPGYPPGCQPGYPPGYVPQPYFQQPPDDSSPGLATASLVLGICSLVLAILSLPLGALGLILALLSRGSGHLKGRSLAGFVTSLIGLCLGIVILLCLVFLWGSLLSGPSLTRLQQEMEYIQRDTTASAQQNRWGCLWEEGEEGDMTFSPGMNEEELVEASPLWTKGFDL